MNIQFDSNISQSEAQGIILLLQSLFPSLNNSQPVNSAQTQLSDPAPAPTPAPATEALQQTETRTGGPTLVQSDPTAATELTTRKRRTKAEIAADEAQAKAQAALDAGTPIAEAPEAQPATEPTITPITKEELTSLANGFIQRHSMEDAFAAINAFGCSRINEAMALPPEKLAALAEKLRG
jgi:hypothetical protein